jgi:transcription factor C subunit 6
LAISTLTDDNETPVKRSETPAAYDRRPSKSGIQIWRFPVKVTDVSAEDELSSKPLDTSSPQPYTLETPSIALMLCNDWGPARCLKWCPVKQDFGDPNILGYLAGVYSDGVLRVLKVVLPTEDENCQDSADACEFCKFTIFASEGI